jgi:hypothetical protein
VIALFKDFAGKMILIIGLAMTAAVFIRFTAETAKEAKALSLRNRDEIIDLKANLADQVADRMLLINNNTEDRLDAKFEKINDKLNRIERKVGN